MYYPSYVPYNLERDFPYMVYPNVHYEDENERSIDSPVLPFVAGLAGGSLIGLALASKNRPPLYPAPPPPMMPPPPPIPYPNYSFHPNYGGGVFHYGPQFGPNYGINQQVR